MDNRTVFMTVGCKFIFASRRSAMYPFLHLSFARNYILKWHFPISLNFPVKQIQIIYFTFEI